MYVHTYVCMYVYNVYVRMYVYVLYILCQYDRSLALISEFGGKGGGGVLSGLISAEVGGGVLSGLISGEVGGEGREGERRGEGSGRSGGEGWVSYTATYSGA